MKDSTQNSCVSVPHDFYLFGGGEDGGERGGGVERGKWGEESDQQTGPGLDYCVSGLGCVIQIKKTKF